MGLEKKPHMEIVTANAHDTKLYKIKVSCFLVVIYNDKNWILTYSGRASPSQRGYSRQLEIWRLFKARWHVRLDRPRCLRLETAHSNFWRRFCWGKQLHLLREVNQLSDSKVPIPFVLNKTTLLYENDILQTNYTNALLSVNNFCNSNCNLRIWEISSIILVYVEQNYK